MSTALYHLNEFLLYLCAIFGAILADSLLGKYKTILYMTMTYVLGTTIIAIASMDFEFLSIKVTSFIGMVAVMIGSGGVKSCQNALGGDLFKLPEQTKILDDFFTMNFIALKIGQVSGMTVLPILYSDVECLQEQDCYPLAYGFSAILMLMALCIFWMGRKSYVNNMPGSNVIVEVLSCIFVSFSTSFDFFIKIFHPSSLLKPNLAQNAKTNFTGWIIQNKNLVNNL
jgi:solute carrier family 15 (oligopeptide transporter), member 1